MSREKPVTAVSIRAGKGGERIVMVTAYDATFAAIFDAAGIDIRSIVEVPHDFLEDSNLFVLFHSCNSCSSLFGLPMRA